MTNDTSATPQKLFLPYFFDIVAPILGYLVVHWFGARAIWALTAGGLIAGASTAVNSIRRKGLDRVGVLVILEIVASIGLLFLTRDPRLLLIRPSFYTGIAAVYLVFTSVVGRPLSFDGAKPMATHGDPQRLAAYELAWRSSPEFRRAHKVVTFGFGLALAADSVLRVVIVYRYPVERSAWLSNVPHVVAIILIIAASALAGRTFKRLVESSRSNAS